jgi:hypothetical protein
LAGLGACDLIAFVPTTDLARAWTTPGGDRVAWFEDPDGNTASITQFVRV